MHLTLSALDGDAGARALFMSEAVERIDVEDANTLRDVDLPRICVLLEFCLRALVLGVLHHRLHAGRRYRDEFSI